MDTVRLALWSINYGHPVESLEGWLALVEKQAQDARAQGATMLVLPEYACVHWYHFAPALTEKEVFHWLDTTREAVLPRISAIAANTGIAIMAGTYPVAVNAPYPDVLFKQDNDTRTQNTLTRYHNRAYLFGRDGALIHTQDKMVMTPWELNENCDNMHSGAAINAVEIDGVKYGIVICLDVQQSMVVHTLFNQNVDILLVPSMTMHPSGYNRVSLNARARAVEGLVGVAMVGGVGIPPRLEGKETNFAGAAFYGPCEMDMQPDGIIAKTEAAYTRPADFAGDLLVADIPLAAIRKKRLQGAEAWPGLIKSPAK